MNRLPDRIVPMAVALGAFVLVIAFFSPRFMLWEWTDLPPTIAYYPPEFNRAVDTLQQLDDPTVTIKDPGNQVINWRLLFPVLGHYLHLSRRVFLALPHLGCLLVIGYVARLVLRESGDRWAAFLASALVATASWFFISTGWLAYFDSWYLLGLLVLSFSRSSVATALACLLTPWVDERFVLTMPLGLVIRAVHFQGTERGRVVFEGLRLLAFVSPYVLIRLVALATADDAGSAAHLRSHLDYGRLTRAPALLVDGIWSGLRGLWLFVAAPVGILIAKGRPIWGVLLALTTVGTTVVNVLVANDLSRTMSILIPGAVLGMVMLLRARPLPARRLLAIVLLFNLLTPARHVILGWNESARINPLHVEWRYYRHPPPHLAGLHRIRANALARKEDFRRALAEFDESLRLEPNSPESLIGRGLCLVGMARPREAAACFDAAVRLAPSRPDVYRARARFLSSYGLVSEAMEDLSTALRLLPPTSTDRQAVENELAGLRQASRRLSR